MRIRTQFILLASLMSLTIILVAVISISIFANTIERFNGITQKVEQLHEDYDEISNLGQQVMTAPYLARPYRNWEYKAEQFNINFRQFSSHVKEVRELQTKEVQAALETASRKWDEQWVQIKEIQNLITQLIRMPGAGGATKPGLILLKERYDLYSVNTVNVKIIYMNEITGGLMRNNLAILVDEVNIAKERAIIRIFNSILISISAVVLILILVFVYIQRTISKNLQKLQTKVRNMSTGDFSSSLDISQNNEFAHLFDNINEFVNEFSKIINGVKVLASESNNIKQKVNQVTDQSVNDIGEITGNISVMTGQINQLVADIGKSSDTIKHFFDRTKQLGSKIEEQAYNVEESSTSIVEMSTSLLNISDIAMKRRQAGESLVTIVADGGEKVQKTNDLVRQTAQDVNDILQIIDIINTIADQTNLLAMNASIEAAHAGDAGKGFAVVAQEIRKLAEMTNNNARKIQEVIDIVANRMKTVQESSNESKFFFDHIQLETGNFNVALEEIARAIGEISSGSNEIMSVMKDLSTLSHEIKSDSEVMREDTVNLDTLMGNIRNFGETVQSEIGKINTSASGINASMEEVKKMNSISVNSIANLYETVSRFKTRMGDFLEQVAQEGNGKAEIVISDEERSSILKETEKLVSDKKREKEEKEIPREVDQKEFPPVEFASEDGELLKKPETAEASIPKERKTAKKEAPKPNSQKASQNAKQPNSERESEILKKFDFADLKANDEEKKEEKTEGYKDFDVIKSQLEVKSDISQILDMEDI